MHAVTGVVVAEAQQRVPVVARNNLQVRHGSVGVSALRGHWSLRGHRVCVVVMSYFGGRGGEADGWQQLVLTKGLGNVLYSFVLCLLLLLLLFWGEVLE